MAIELNPNNINISSGGAGRTGERFREAQAQLTAEPKPRRASQPANLNVIPSDESLHTQIRSALASRREGNAPDRGSILNLLV